MTTGDAAGHPRPRSGGRHAATRPPITAQTWVLPRTFGALARARGLVRDTLATWGWPDDRTDDVVQVVSELVGNVLRHTSAEAQLTLAPTADGLHIRVGDHARGLLVLQRPANVEGGYGLRLLDLLTTEWTVEQHASGKQVYAHIRR
ncbi:ATP-binding protein [Streptomyces sp. SID3343]|uniref:ATP-binding protein n=1 Tax=Streptomyces sp. SID3343 TaxID=2690260 RepID=UPI00136CD586|nr:hypothetical protein [Streptomyces sp. SID3343]